MTGPGRVLRGRYRLPSRPGRTGGPGRAGGRAGGRVERRALGAEVCRQDRCVSLDEESFQSRTAEGPYLQAD